MAGIWSEQPLRNNPKKSVAKMVMSDYIMSVTGGAAATEPLADGNAMLCKNAHGIKTKALERYDNRINPLANRKLRPPEMAEEI